MSTLLNSWVEVVTKGFSTKESPIVDRLVVGCPPGRVVVVSCDILSVIDVFGFFNH